MAPHLTRLPRPVLLMFAALLIAALVTVSLVASRGNATRYSAGLTGMNSENWSGVVSRCGVGRCTQASGRFVQPSYVGMTCGATYQTHVHWVGLGGFTTDRLLQAGTDHRGRVWFEAISGDRDTSLTIVPGVVIAPGHQVKIDLTYRPSTGAVTFGVWDLTTNKGWTKTYTSFTDGWTNQRFSARSAWDGTSAEYVDERLAVNGGSQTHYLKSRAGSTLWTSALTTSSGRVLRADSATFSPVRLVMVDNLRSGRPMSVPTVGTADTWTAAWRSCR